MKALKVTLRIALPLVIVAVGIYAATKISEMGVAPRRRDRARKAPRVEVTTLQARDFQITLRSRGIVRARSRGMLAAEVSGRVTAISDSFRDGGFFRAGEELLRFDVRDYELAVTRLKEEQGQAAAAIGELDAEDSTAKVQVELARQQHELAQRQVQRVKELQGRGVSSASATEEAERAELAARTRWIGLRDQKTMRAAKRKRLERAVALTQARLAQAELELTRTRVLAPYAGRVLRRQADVGQWLNRGSALATIYAVDVAEVRLPLTQRQLARLRMPSRTPGAGSARPRYPQVKLSSAVGGTTHLWTGRIDRSEGVIDEASRQLFVIATVQKPYQTTADGRPPLRVGTFVFAEIEGRTLRRVFVLPRGAVQGLDQVLLLGPDGKLRRRTVRVVWRDHERVVVDQGLKDGEQLCLTQVVFAGESVAVSTGKKKRGSR